MRWNEEENSWNLENCRIREWKNNDFIFYSLKDTVLSIKDVNPEIIKKDLKNFTEYLEKNNIERIILK